MENSTDSVSTLELKRLLFDLKEKRPDICIRYRLLGKFWMLNFAHVVSVGDRGAKFYDPLTKTPHDVTDISDIVQFELDKKFQIYQPHFHYDVMWTREF
ncbi:MAG TPA: hypothetical protein VG737_11645 [Cyclobacteriaceae bacterium]|nr:hypothetical protein [Cyclobacteriaceae bacterium]